MAIDFQGIAILIAAFSAAFVSVGTFVRAGRTAERINNLEENTKKLEVNTNSIKDALVSATAEKEFARGGQVERDKQVAITGAKDAATIAERSRSGDVAAKT